MTACAHRPGYYSSYPSSGGYYSNNNYYPNYGNSQYYQHHHTKPYYPSGNWGYGKPYPGGGYNSNHYYNNYYYDNDHNNGNNYVKDPSRPWVHGDNRYDKRLYRQPTRDDNHGGGWFGHHNDNDDNHSSNWNSWHNDNDRQRPQPQALPQQPPHDFTENRPQGGNFNFNGENPHGRPVRPSAVEEHVHVERPQITPRPMPVEPIRMEQPVAIGGGHQRPERDSGNSGGNPVFHEAPVQPIREQPVAIGGGHQRPERDASEPAGNHVSHDRKHEGRGFGR